jgi:hypothetical protein
MRWPGGRSYYNRGRFDAVKSDIGCLMSEIAAEVPEDVAGDGIDHIADVPVWSG